MDPIPGEDAQTAEMRFYRKIQARLGMTPPKMQVLEGFRGGLPGARERTLIFYRILQVTDMWSKSARKPLQKTWFLSLHENSQKR